MTLTYAQAHAKRLILERYQLELCDHSITNGKTVDPLTPCEFEQLRSQWPGIYSTTVAQLTAEEIAAVTA